MTTQPSVLRARQFEIAEKRQQLADLEGMIADFRRMAADLDQQIEAEHQRAGVRDPNHFAYPPFAKAARRRRENLLASVADLAGKAEAARGEVDRLEADLVRLQQSSGRNEERSSFTRRPRGRSRRASTAPAGL